MDWGLKEEEEEECAPCAPEDMRFLRAKSRRYDGLGCEEHGGCFKGPFCFVQLADTQLGMESKFRGPDEKGWDAELALTRRAVEEVNRMQPRPAFVIVCGDLADEFPEEEKGRSDSSNARRDKQVADLKGVFKLIDPDIPLLCLCGNHDIGNRPNAVTIRKFVESFGDDYFTFWCAGVRCMVVNSQLWKHDEDAHEERVAMDAWLDAELAGSKTRTLVFSHVPPFVFSPTEKDEYFNLSSSLRLDILERMASRGVVAWFAGHYHRNAGGKFRSASGQEVEVVVSAAVGCQLTDKPGGEPLGLSGIGGHLIGEQHSGLRVVEVHADRVEHRWATFEELASTESTGLHIPKDPTSSSSAGSGVLSYFTSIVCCVGR